MGNKGERATIWADAIWSTRKYEVTLQIGPYRISRQFSAGLNAKTDNRDGVDTMHSALDKALNRVVATESEMFNEAGMREDLRRVIKLSKKLEQELPDLEREALEELAKEKQEQEDAHEESGS